MKRIITIAAAVVAVSLVAVWVLPGPPERMGITGLWSFDVRLPTGGGTATFGFEQDGEQLRGAYRGSYGTAELSGTVSGDQVEFAFETERTGRVRFAGRIHGPTMEGTCDYGESLGTGTWTAERDGGR
jgi:hypothetical protein